jgi:hypothetical protein
MFRVSTVVLLIALFLTRETKAQWKQTIGPPWGSDKVLCLGDNNGTLLAGLAGVGVYVSTDGGNRWTNPQTYPRDGSVFAIEEVGLYELLGIEYGVMIARNPVRTWSYASTGIDDSHFYSVTSFFFAHSMMFAGTKNDGIYLATLVGSDSIAKWTAINKGLPGSISTATVTCFGYDDNGNAVAGINPCGLFVSTNNGQSWGSYGLSNTPINSYLNIGYTHVAGTSNGIYISTNNGNRWNQVNTLNVTSLTRDGSTGYAYAGTSRGIYLSRDSGVSWQSANERLADTIVTALSISNGYLFAGTDSHGVWRRPLTDFDVIATVEPAETKQNLAAYPNPFSQATTIRITPEASGYAEISIVNLLGAQVARVFSGELDASEHTFTWDAARMAAPRGMYECIIRMNGKTQALPMVVE